MFQTEREMESKNVNWLAKSAVRNWAEHCAGENILQMIEGVHTVAEALLK